MIDDVILHSQCQAVEQGVVQVPFPRIHIVHGERDFLAEHFVVKHQKGSIKLLKLVVPENMKYLRLGNGCISKKPRIVEQYSLYFSCKAGLLISPQI